MSTQVGRKETIRLLLYVLQDILGENGKNLLGTYELISGSQVINTSPAISANYPLLSNSQNTTETSARKVGRRVQPESGIECIVNTDPDMMTSFFRGQNQRSSIKYYEIALDQYNPTEGLSEAIEAIVTDSRLYIQEEPVVRPAMWNPNGSGVLPARALLYHQQSYYLS